MCLFFDDNYSAVQNSPFFHELPCARESYVCKDNRGGAEGTAWGRHDDWPWADVCHYPSVLPGWPGSRWRIALPNMDSPTSTRFLDIGAHYGDKLKLPITKHNISKSKREALHECMELQGNFSSLAREALRHVLASSDSAFDTSWNTAVLNYPGCPTRCFISLASHERKCSQRKLMYP